MGPSTVEVARQRWRAAAESTFAALITDPSAYARAVATIGVIAAEFRARNADLGRLAEAMADPEELRAVTAAAPPPPGVPMAMLVGVACSMRERELIVADVREQRRRAIQDARDRGRAWAVLKGPEDVAELTGGPTGSACSIALHLASGTELRVAVDVWAPEPYRIDVVSPGSSTGQAFTRRDEWLAEAARRRSEVETP